MCRIAYDYRHDLAPIYHHIIIIIAPPSLSNLVSVIAQKTQSAPAGHVLDTRQVTFAHCSPISVGVQVVVVAIGGRLTRIYNGQSLLLTRTSGIFIVEHTFP